MAQRVSFKVPEDPFTRMWREYCQEFNAVFYPFPTESSYQSIPNIIKTAELILTNNWTNENNVFSIKILAKKSDLTLSQINTILFSSAYSMNRANLIFEADSKRFRKKASNNNEKFYFVDPEKTPSYVQHLKRFGGYSNES